MPMWHDRPSPDAPVTFAEIAVLVIEYGALALLITGAAWALGWYAAPYFV